MHTPVLLQQAIEKLNVKADGRYIDATFGEGGYSSEISKKGGLVLGIDLDISQIQNHKSKIPNLELVQGNFADIEAIAKANNFFPVDGVVFDLGLSMRQLNESGRGLSYKRFNEPLDMRIDQTIKTTAKDLIKGLSAEKLYDVLAKNSEELKSKEIAYEIKYRRKMETVDDLIKAIDKAVGYTSSSVYSRIFQALRIAVNNEFDNLKRGLIGAVKIIKPEGRIVIVTFHSLEDRIVKNFARENKLEFLEKKPVKGERSFERSAKLRVIKV